MHDCAWAGCESVRRAPGTQGGGFPFINQLFAPARVSRRLGLSQHRFRTGDALREDVAPGCGRGVVASRTLLWTVDR